MPVVAELTWFAQVTSVVYEGAVGGVPQSTKLLPMASFWYVKVCAGSVVPPVSRPDPSCTRSLPYCCTEVSSERPVNGLG